MSRHNSEVPATRRPYPEMPAARRPYRHYKPFAMALRDEAIQLGKGVMAEHPRGSLRWNCQRLLIAGDFSSIKELADRLDGKAVQPISGSDDHPPIGIETKNLNFSVLTDENLTGLRALFAGYIADADNTDDRPRELEENADSLVPHLQLRASPTPPDDNREAGTRRARRN